MRRGPALPSDFYASSSRRPYISSSSSFQSHRQLCHYRYSVCIGLGGHIISDMMSITLTTEESAISRNLVRNWNLVSVRFPFRSLWSICGHLTDDMHYFNQRVDQTSRQVSSCLLTFHFATKGNVALAGPSIFFNHAWLLRGSLKTALRVETQWGFQTY